jgi:transposase
MPPTRRRSARRYRDPPWSRAPLSTVPVKSEAQQAALMLHRARDLLVRQRTQLINAVRGHLAEFGIVEAQGAWNLPRVLAHLEAEGELPEVARQVLRLLAAQLEEAESRLGELDARIAAWHKASPASQRLATIPGIGPLVATAITATIADPSTFRSGREFAAWLGLVPRQRSTGGKQRLGRISREGDGYIRRLLIIGAQAVLLRSKAAHADPWMQGLLARRPRLVVAVALANKTARVAWAVMTKGQPYRQPAVA